MQLYRHPGALKLCIKQPAGSEHSMTLLMQNPFAVVQSYKHVWHWPHCFKVECWQAPQGTDQTHEAQARPEPQLSSNLQSSACRNCDKLNPVGNEPAAPFGTLHLCHQEVTPHCCLRGGIDLRMATLGKACLQAELIKRGALKFRDLKFH